MKAPFKGLSPRRHIHFRYLHFITQMGECYVHHFIICFYSIYVLDLSRSIGLCIRSSVLVRWVHVLYKWHCQTPAWGHYGVFCRFLLLQAMRNFSMYAAYILSSVPPHPGHLPSSGSWKLLLGALVVPLQCSVP